MTNVEARVAEVLADPSASRWLTAALRGALDRDVVDAANDAAFLAKLLEARARAALKK